MSDSLWPHESQHARPPCPSPTPGVYSKSCPSSWWCHPAISSVIPFSSCPQSLPASGSFPTSQLFAWGGPTYWSFSFIISPSNEHLGLLSFRMDWLELLAVQGSGRDYISGKSELQLLLSYSFSLLSETCSLLSVNLTFNRKDNLADSRKCLWSTLWRYRVVTDWL